MDNKNNQPTSAPDKAAHDLDHFTVLQDVATADLTALSYDIHNLMINDEDLIAANPMMAISNQTLQTSTILSPLTDVEKNIIQQLADGQDLDNLITDAFNNNIPFSVSSPLPNIVVSAAGEDSLPSPNFVTPRVSTNDDPFIETQPNSALNGDPVFESTQDLDIGLPFDQNFIEVENIGVIEDIENEAGVTTNEESATDNTNGNSQSSEPEEIANPLIEDSVADELEQSVNPVANDDDGNNGHGNDADGVDPSNPGQGNGQSNAGGNNNTNENSHTGGNGNNQSEPEAPDEEEVVVTQPEENNEPIVEEPVADPVVENNNGDGNNGHGNDADGVDESNRGQSGGATNAGGNGNKNSNVGGNGNANNNDGSNDDVMADDDGNNGHGNDADGVDPSNPGQGNGQSNAGGNGNQNGNQNANNNSNAGGNSNNQPDPVIESPAVEDDVIDVQPEDNTDPVIEDHIAEEEQSADPITGNQNNADNNGHGNDADGFDESNPGQGGGQSNAGDGNNNANENSNVGGNGNSQLNPVIEDSVIDEGDGNNGHGNDADSVDSSNPGQGNGQRNARDQANSKDDNGHGNDEDGIDNSNPGRGGVKINADTKIKTNQNGQDSHIDGTLDIEFFVFNDGEFASDPAGWLDAIDQTAQLNSVNNEITDNQNWLDDTQSNNSSLNDAHNDNSDLENNVVVDIGDLTGGLADMVSNDLPLF